MSTLIRHKSGVFYLISSIDGKRVWRSLRTRDKREAYQLFLRDESSPPSTKTLTLIEAQEEYMEYVRVNLSRGSIDIYRNVFSQFNKFMSNRPITEITPRDIDLYKSHRISMVSPNSVNHDLRTLRAFFNRLLIWQLVAKNPCTGIKDIKLVETTRPFLSAADLNALLQHTKGTSIHEIISFAAMTGLRRGELLNLTWKDVDLERGTILVRSSISYRTKSGKVRAVPLNSASRKILSEVEKTSDYIFPGDRGGKK